ncbi:MAG: hypothetical protein R3F17_15945 [Planctomycetota bacterium]
MNRLRRRLIGTDPDGPALVLWALGLAAVQTVGAQVRHDWFDAVALLVLSVLAGATWAWHRQNPISFVLWIERSARAWLHRWVRYRPSLGIDFRGDPPVRRGVPRVFLVAPALAALLVAACFAGGMGWLGELRFWARDGAYVFYLPVVAAVWTLSLLMAFRGVSSVVLQIREGFLRRRQEGRLLSRDLELRVYLFLGLDLVLGMLFLPLWVAEGLLALAGLSCVVLWALPRAAPLRVMWRNEAGEMRSFAMRTYYVLVGGALYAMSWALIWTLEGQGGGGSRDAMDLSRWLARPCAWGCAAAYGAVALRAVGTVVVAAPLRSCARGAAGGTRGRRADRRGATRRAHRARAAGARRAFRRVARALAGAGARGLECRSQRRRRSGLWPCRSTI